jgi:hypothetical protein
MTRSRDVADTQDNLGGAVAPFVAGKNKIINGDFAIAQRGTSVTVGSSSYTYTLDRWKTFSTNASTTVSRDTSAPIGFSYSLKLQRPSGSTGTGGLSAIQIIETVNMIPLQGQNIAFSLYLKKGANYSGGTVTVQLLTGTGTDQGGDPYAFTGLGTAVNDASYSPTTSFVRIPYFGNVASSVKEMAIAINYTPTGTAGADDALYITGVQLEAGNVATPFTTASGSIGGELALCQRYYYRVNSTLNANSFLSVLGTAASTTAWAGAFALPVTMRSNVSAIDYSGMVWYDGTNAVSISTLTLNQTHPSTPLLYGTGTGLTAFRPYYLFANNSTSAYLGFSAEL